MAQLKDTTVTGDLSVSGNQTVTGNLGIGTTTPVGKLDVSGGVIYARNGLADTDKEQIRIGRSDNDNWYHSIHSYHTAAFDGNYLKFRLNTGGPAPYHQQDVMTMLGNGNVGIGNNNPTERLDVLGNIKASSIKIGYTEFKENNISLVTGTYNEIDILKFGRTKTLQHSISSTQDTTGGGTNAIRFNVWNNLNAKVKVLDLNVGYGGTFGTATINGNIVVSGKVDGRDISVDGAKLDNIAETIIGTFDMATAGTITVNSASSGLVLIKGFRAIVTVADAVSIPGSFSLKFYNASGSQITYSMAVQTFVGFGANASGVLATTSDFVADLSQGNITIEWTKSTATSHIWKYFLDVQLVDISNI